MVKIIHLSKNTHLRLVRGKIFIMARGLMEYWPKINMLQVSQVAAMVTKGAKIMTRCLFSEIISLGQPMAPPPTAIVWWLRRNPPQYNWRPLKMGTYWIWKIPRRVLPRKMKILRAPSSTIGLFRNRSSRIWCLKRPSRSLKRLRSSRMRSGGACSHSLWCLGINSTPISPRASLWKLLSF
jgi:hypothetical protein